MKQCRSLYDSPLSSYLLLCTVPPQNNPFTEQSLFRTFPSLNCQSGLSPFWLALSQVQNGRPLLALEVKEGVNSHQLGSGLEPIELRWVARRITQFLARTLGRSVASSPPPLNRSLY